MPRLNRSPTPEPPPPRPKPDIVERDTFSRDSYSRDSYSRDGYGRNSPEQMESRLPPMTIAQRSPSPSSPSSPDIEDADDGGIIIPGQASPVSEDSMSTPLSQNFSNPNSLSQPFIGPATCDDQQRAKAGFSGVRFGTYD